jgi:hypothetical protein
MPQDAPKIFERNLAVNQRQLHGLKRGSTVAADGGELAEVERHVVFGFGFGYAGVHGNAQCGRPNPKMMLSLEEYVTVAVIYAWHSL